MKTKHANQQGSVMVEALIAILLFSIGILAVIAMQATAIKNSTDAKYRTDASLLANQIIGQMWISDKTNLATFNTSAAYTAWVAKVADTMPGATLTGTMAPTVAPGAGNDTYTVTIKWQLPGEKTGTGAAATPIVHQYSAIATLTTATTPAAASAPPAGP